VKTQKIAFKKTEPMESTWIVKKKRKRFVKRTIKMTPMNKTPWRESSMAARKEMKVHMKAFRKFKDTIKEEEFVETPWITKKKCRRFIASKTTKCAMPKTTWRNQSKGLRSMIQQQKAIFSQ
jgi:hypothetical protein